MEIFRYSFEKDKPAWILLMISLVGLSACYIDIGIPWPHFIFTIRDISISILTSSLAGSIFYIIANTSTTYSKRKYVLKMISDSLIEIRSLTKDIYDKFINSYNVDKSIGNGIKLKEADINYLLAASKDIFSEFNVVNTYIDILPAQYINKYSKIATSNSFARMRYGNFNDVFTSDRFNEIITGIKENEKDLTYLIDSISKLITTQRKSKSRKNKKN